ncbi:hypothetical protein BJ742DRAFT_830227 [Cladochytrium replicatum]|nr:hypothetical protein BJ742DRAFT_830227 [Cladochytrium replicatum]
MFNSMWKNGRTGTAGLVLGISICLVSIISSVNALHADQAGLFDWHKQLIGAPTHVAFSNFSGKSVVNVATSKNVVASLALETGDIKWRHLLQPDEAVHGIIADTEAVLTISGIKPFFTRLWDGATGHLIWENAYAPSTAGAGRSSVVVHGEDFVTVSGGKAVTRINGRTGKPVWRWVVKASVVTCEAILTTSDRVISAGVERQSSADSLLITPIDIASGEAQEQTTVALGQKISGNVLSSEQSLYWLDTTGAVWAYSIGATAPVKVAVKGYDSISSIDDSVSGGLRVTLTDGNSAILKLNSLDGEIVNSFTPRYGSPRKLFVENSFELVVTADGAAHMVENDIIKWTRDESLAYATSSVFVELPERHGLSEDHDELDESVSQSKSLNPVSRFIRRVLSQSRNFSRNISVRLQSLLRKKPNDEDSLLVRDSIGVRKLALIGSSTGKLTALDTKSGKNVWSRYFGSSSTISDIFLVRQSVVKFPPIAVVVVNSGASTAAVKINALTGEILEEVIQSEGVSKVMQTNVEEPSSRLEILAFVNNNAQVTLYPNTTEAHQSFQSILDNFYLHVADPLGGDTIRGYYLQAPSADGIYGSKIVWSFQLPEGEKFAAFATRESPETVASLGRVLGNRQVLYKYLNPNMIAFATLKVTAESSSVFIYLFDTVTGSILYRAGHPAGGDLSTSFDKVSHRSAIQVLQCENWVVYTYFNHGPEAAGEELVTTSSDEEGDKDRRSRRRRKEATKERVPVPDAKGQEVVVLEVYEDAKPDKRIESTTFSSLVAKKPNVLTQAYTLGQTSSAIGVTSTIRGITTREVLFGLPSGVYGVSRRFLDPRRTLGNPTSDDKEEQLFPYKAGLDIMPREVASYNLEVLGTERIRSTPSSLESTSLILSYGLDLFCTRRMPSKTFDLLSESFSYSSLIATMIALLIGIVVARSFVARKKLREAWK